MERYKVNASSLWLRSTPSKVSDDNQILRLMRDELVEVTDTADSTWYKVRTLRPTVSEGYSSSQYLIKATDDTDNMISSVTTPIHLKKGSRAERANRLSYASPLSENGLPIMNNSSVESKIQSMQAIVSYLKVDSSLRYLKTKTATYCNIYAYDYCYLTQAFLPRVWWNDSALKELLAGHSIALGSNRVHEVRANDIFRWLTEWGDDFGWKRVYDLDELQQQVNLGKAGIISGRHVNANQSGHISCVIPESAAYTAKRINGKVLCPLGSQAGSNNFQLNNTKAFQEYTWWISKRFADTGFWYYDGPIVPL